MSSTRGWTAPPPPPPPPPGQDPPAAASAPAANSGMGDWAWAMALLFPGLAFMLLSSAWAFMNSHAPQVGWAGLLLVMLALLGVGAVWSVVYTHPGDQRKWSLAIIVPAVVVALPLGVFVLQTLEEMYGIFGFLSFMFGAGFVVLVFVPVYLVLLAAALVVRLAGQSRSGDRIAQFAGLVTGGGFATAGLLMLFTLRRQEELARQAHETPGLHVLGVLLVLLLAVLSLRRGRS